MRPALITPRRLVAALLVGAAALAGPGSARAAFVAYDSKVDIKSIAPSFGSGGSYTGSIEVDNNGPTSASVRITLTNTSGSQYLTAFGISLPGTLTSGSLASKPTSNWQLLADADYSNGSMFDTGSFGQFDIGAAVGSSWHTSGASVNGIAMGATGVFVFDLVGPGANITADALMTYLSTNGSAGIGARFRTAGSYSSSNGSKVLATVTKSYPPPTTPPGAVPAPPAVLLALAGVGCLLGRGAFRRKPAATA
ncbi:hypothetical protein [Urbifossiella limnaea]|uniref:PEP-CTERM sorting domain-containing protein n=1 Tax=Urbifossiella limnaea TaxID=2528023 RepID=A0A517Y0D7_9BACT|nr:hypothetical protein [Urbifossiella limnaea]QDU23168.1 hypothetical protein ETAA1_51600 [Urbifossiella limnaea]